MTDNTLVLDRLLKASPEKVWRCWTEPDLVKQWFAPRPVQTTEVEIDPRSGGIFRTVMVVPDHGEMAGDAGCILIAEPARRLVWTNCVGPEFVPNVIDASAFGMSVDISFTAEDGGCRYRAKVFHATPADTEKHAAMGFHEGWGTAARQLEELAQTL